MTTIRPLTAVAFALAAGMASAAELPWNHYSWDVPFQTGDYVAVPGGDSTTLGAMTISVTSDARRIIGGALYYYNPEGNTVVQAIAGELSLSDDVTLRESGVIGKGALTAYDMKGGTCRGCAPRDRVNTPTGEVIEWKWTGPRAGTLTIDGVTQKMVHAYSGPPLVAPNDFSGDYLMVFRRDSGTSANDTNHSESVSTVRLTRVTQPRTYEAVVDTGPSVTPWGSVALPPAGAALYDAHCVSRYCPLWYVGASPPLYHPRDGGSDPHEYTIWFDDAGNGRLFAAELKGGKRAVADRGAELMRVYGNSERVVGFRAKPKSWPNPIIEEIGLFRIDPETLKGKWRLPACSPLSFPENCNSSE